MALILVSLFSPARLRLELSLMLLVEDQRLLIFVFGVFFGFHGLHAGKVEEAQHYALSVAGWGVGGAVVQVAKTQSGQF